MDVIDTVQHPVQFWIDSNYYNHVIAKHSSRVDKALHDSLNPNVYIYFTESRRNYLIIPHYVTSLLEHLEYALNENDVLKATQLGLELWVRTPLSLLLFLLTYSITRGIAIPRYIALGTYLQFLFLYAPPFPVVDTLHRSKHITMSIVAWLEQLACQTISESFAKAMLDIRIPSSTSPSFKAFNKNFRMREPHPLVHLYNLEATYPTDVASPPSVWPEPSTLSLERMWVLNLKWLELIWARITREISSNYVGEVHLGKMYVDWFRMEHAFPTDFMSPEVKEGDGPCPILLSTRMSLLYLVGVMRWANHHVFKLLASSFPESKRDLDIKAEKTRVRITASPPPYPLRQSTLLGEIPSKTLFSYP